MRIYRNGVPIEKGQPIKITKRTDTDRKTPDAPGGLQTRNEAGGMVKVTERVSDTVVGIQLTDEHRKLIRRREKLEAVVYGLRMQRRTLKGEITQLRERIRQIAPKVGRQVDV